MKQGDFITFYSKKTKQKLFVFTQLMFAL